MEQPSHEADPICTRRCTTGVGTTGELHAGELHANLPNLGSFLRLFPFAVPTRGKALDIRRGEYDGGSFVPRRRQDFWKQWSETGVGGQTTNWAISKGAQTFLRPFPFLRCPHTQKGLMTSQGALARAL